MHPLYTYTGHTSNDGGQTRQTTDACRIAICIHYTRIQDRPRMMRQDGLRTPYRHMYPLYTYTGQTPNDGGQTGQTTDTSRMAICIR